VRQQFCWRIFFAMKAELEKQSPCKVNLLLNILRKRPDGFHELETVMHPIAVFDTLAFARGGQGIELSCSNATLPTDSSNLVFRAAKAFMDLAGLSEGVRIHLEKRIPMAAGLGGGSGNAAVTLLALNELFDQPIAASKVEHIAASLGSDVPFFLQQNPALATGRGERIQPLEPFPALRGAAFLLIHPGFGIPTAWAYESLTRFPEAVNGSAGRAKKLIEILDGRLPEAGRQLYNSLEAPALKKYPLLWLFQDFLRRNGAAGALMSGSGSSTFGICPSIERALELQARFKQKFGEDHWSAVVAA
jgi:4-diphosphocytidyl-2-C-methyl-D-erythritol kinase